MPRTDYQVLEDFEGIFVVHQGVEAVTAGVLDFELLARMRSALTVSVGGCVAQFGELREQSAAVNALEGLRLAGSPVSVTYRRPA